MNLYLETGFLLAWFVASYKNESKSNQTYKLE